MLVQLTSSLLSCTQVQRGICRTHKFMESNSKGAGPSAQHAVTNQDSRIQIGKQRKK